VLAWLHASISESKQIVDASITAMSLRNRSCHVPHITRNMYDALICLTKKTPISRFLKSGVKSRIDDLGRLSHSNNSWCTPISCAMEYHSGSKGVGNASEW
jgi:hypothetical protein